MTHYYEKKQTSELRKEKIHANILGNSLEFFTGSGVFSKSGIDKGSMLLANSAIIKENWKVLDLGCGYGVIGIAIAKAFPSSNVLLIDINKRAASLAKKNIELNNVVNATAMQGDIFEIFKTKESADTIFNTILLNPP